MKRPATLAELQQLSPTASLQLARASAQRLPTPSSRPRRRSPLRPILEGSAALAILTGGYVLASILTGGHPF